MFNELKQNYTLVDLFCGAGGLSCGLEQAGFTPIFALDIDKIYAETYHINHINTNITTQDIRLFNVSSVKEINKLSTGTLDLLAGGPPCQGFSINAPIRSLSDKRNHLFREFIRIADELKPKAILIENVPGIISLGRGTVVEAIYTELERIGYSVDHRIIFAGHYGIPQLRFRTVFLAFRDIKKFEFPYPTHNAQAIANFTGAKEFCQQIGNPKKLLEKVTVADAISDLPALTPGASLDGVPYPNAPATKYQAALRNGSSLIYNHSCAKLGKVNLERLRYIPQGGSWRDIPFDLLPAGLKRARRSDHTKRYGRLHPDALCSTILTKCDPHWGSFFHPTQDRALSVREAARIQSFPDYYRFTGNLTQQFEQVGNAVPPLLAKVLGEQIIRILYGTK